MRYVYEFNNSYNQVMKLLFVLLLDSVLFFYIKKFILIANVTEKILLRFNFANTLCKIEYFISSSIIFKKNQSCLRHGQLKNGNYQSFSFPN